MTLIASFQAGSGPVLLGDLLISGEERVGTPQHIPGLGNVHQVFPEGSGFTPVGLRQKVCLINDYLAVAWAGSTWEARVVLKELSKLPRPITIDAVMQYFSTVPKNTDSAFIGHLLDEITRKQFTFWHGAYRKIRTKSFGEVTAAGSGLEHLQFCIDVLEKDLATQSSFKSQDIRFDMVKTVATLTSILLTQGLNRDITEYKHSLLHYFGGGYETVYNCEGKLRKLENICYIFWNAFCNSEKQIDVPLDFILLNATYTQDVLFLRALSQLTPSESEGICVEAKENAIYVIPPIHKIYSEDERIAQYKNEFKKGFQPEAFCHYTSHFNKDKTPLSNTAALIIKTAQVSRLKFNNSLNIFPIEIDHELFSDICHKAAEIFRQHNRSA